MKLYGKVVTHLGFAKTDILFRVDRSGEIASWFRSRMNQDRRGQETSLIEWKAHIWGLEGCDLGE